MNSGKLKNNILILVIGILVIIGGVLIYKKLNSKKLPPYLVEAVGVVDGDLIYLNTKYPGRVIKLNVDTGDNVKKNEIVAVLNSKEFQDKLNAVENEINAKKSELNFLISKVLDSIKESKLAIAAKEKTLKEIEADIKASEIIIKQDKKDEIRIKNLVKKNLEKHHKLELAILKTKVDNEKLNALKAKKEALIKKIAIFKEKLKTALASKNKINALKNSIKALEAKRDEIETIINELSIKSPVNGYVDTKIANVGEVVGAGGGIVSVIDKKSLYLKIYVDLLNIEKVHLGDKAEIFLDAYPNKPIPAVVTKIAKKAEFTPKEVAVRADRITKVYEVRLKPINSNMLKMGLPATGVILVGKGKLPKSLKELPEL